MDRQERNALDHYLTTEPSWRTDGQMLEDTELRREYTEDVLTLVRKERERQEVLKLQGRFKYTLADAMPEPEKAACIMEEVGEVCRNVLARMAKVTDGDTTDEAMVKELVQVAALSVAWVESLL